MDELELELLVVVVAATIDDEVVEEPLLARLVLLVPVVAEVVDAVVEEVLDGLTLLDVATVPEDVVVIPVVVDKYGAVDDDLLAFGSTVAAGFTLAVLETVVDLVG